MISAASALAALFWSDIGRYVLPATTEFQYKDYTEPDLIKIVETVNQLWTNPDMDNYKRNANFNCPSIQVGQWKQIPDRYFQCNVDFLTCAIRYEFENRIEFKHLKYQPVLPVTLSPSKDTKKILRSLQVKRVDNSKKYMIELKDICHQVELPKNRYLAGNIKSAGMLFDIDQKIMIDRHQFTYGKLRDLKKAFPRKLVDVAPAYARMWYEPVRKVQAKHMSELCHLSGKELLVSEYFDAATFLPKELDGNHQNEFKGPFIYSDSKILENVLGERPCSKLVSRECKPETFILSEQFSWIGVGQVHGGLMEYLPPLFSNDRKKHNVWPSSIFFARPSIYHHLGKRLSWTTDTLLKKTFSDEQADKVETDLDQLPEKLEVGFRCYQKSY